MNKKGWTRKTRKCWWRNWGSQKTNHDCQLFKGFFEFCNCSKWGFACCLHPFGFKTKLWCSRSYQLFCLSLWIWPQGCYDGCKKNVVTDFLKVGNVWFVDCFFAVIRRRMIESTWHYWNFTTCRKCSGCQRYLLYSHLCQSSWSILSLLSSNQFPNICSEVFHVTRVWVY